MTSDVKVSAGGRDTQLGLDGGYRLAGIAPGDVTVEFSGRSGARMPSTFYPGVPDSWSAQRIQLRAGQEKKLDDVTLVAGGFIAGEAPVEAGSWPLHGLVCATPWGSAADFNRAAASRQCVTGNPSGNNSYVIGPMWPGDYRVGFSGSGGRTNGRDGVTYGNQWFNAASVPASASRVTVVDGQVVSGINASLTAGGSITGRVLTSSGVASTTTSIQVLDAQGYQVQQDFPMADSGGKFKVSGLAPGTYRVAFNRVDGSSTDEAQFYGSVHESAGLAAAATVSVAADQTTQLADAQLVSGGVLGGKVVGPDGFPLTDALVEAFTDDGSLVTRSASTDESGRFSIGGLSSGSYKLKINADAKVPGIGTLYSGNATEPTNAALLQSTVGESKDVGVLTYSPVAASGGPGSSVPIIPSRFLDTRSASGPVAAGGTVSFQAGGVNGVPLDASAVVVNLTATETKSEGFLTAYASGGPKPNASNVNFGRGQTVPNLAVVPLGADGKVTIANTSSGTTQVIADVAAYFKGGTPTAVGAFGAKPPSRFLDTRTSSGPVPAGGTISLQIGGVNGIPSNASAAVINLTVTEAKSAGFLTAYASGKAKPNASNVNFGPGQTVPNFAVVPLGPDGKVTIANTSSGTTQVIADVSGYFLPGMPLEPGAFGSITPTRFLDTRTSSGPVKAGGTISFQAAGINGVPENAAGVWVNLTVTEPTSSGYLTGYASRTARPNASNVNYGTGQTVPNLTYLPIGRDGKVTIANTESGLGSTVQIVADVSGYTLR
ncbi:carboxypeptidase-like regulatory domain-containing protein [Pseudarthrobacter chlorophenolicus]|uniref:carboxypeptidase-like regulatory domain-containing protein n=1 Tax=Pseudarthrobacter chlorophenolicus TaxID=85085 RepID=UPI00137934FB|nr:carboxypeptidase-like regulatory domain-containing protein [Pseudarthrobacter chlorophenolicus]